MGGLIRVLGNGPNGSHRRRESQDRKRCQRQLPKAIAGDHVCSSVQRRFWRRRNTSALSGAYVRLHILNR